MSAFGIWAIILTAIYIIYYAVMISIDLFGKKGQKKDGVEVFDTAGIITDGENDDDVEVPTQVVETENGYRIGDAVDESGDDKKETAQEPSQQAIDPVAEEQAKQVLMTDAERQEEHFKDMKERINDSLQHGEPVNPQYQQTMDANELLMALNQPLSKKSRIKRQQIF